MNNKLFKIALSGLALASGSLFAADASINHYVAVKGAFMKPGSRNGAKYKNGGMGDVEFGISYDAWRLGLELSYRQAKVKEWDNKSIQGLGRNDQRLLRLRFDRRMFPLLGRRLGCRSMRLQ